MAGAADDKPVSVRAAPPPGPTLPAPTLPRGGGALARTGEKVTANPQNGTARFGVPVFTSPGRSGFGPSLQLGYDAGAGNGPYGLGWSITVPSISRRTDRGLPRYGDDDESDVFILSGAEDLVPVAAVPRGVEQVVTYRPRTEAAYARVERHVRPDGTSYWVTITRENIRSVYGFSPAAQIADPAAPRRVFRWMLEWSDDASGNVVAYVYKPEDDVGVAPAAYEEGRAHTNLYLKAIAYANPTPRARRDLPPLDLSAGRAAALAGWPLVVLFDYGEHDTDAPTLAESDWPARDDAFSSYRAGFEIRTHRLCRRILMLHRFDALGAEPVVVRSTELGYKPAGALTYLSSVQEIGWQARSGGYDQRPRPALALGYREIGDFDETPRTLGGDAAAHLPAGLDGAGYTLVDLDGEGLPGVLSEDAGRGWLYQRPEGRGDDGAGRLGEVRRIATRPSAGLADGFRLQDVNGDGVMDLVRLRGRPAGVFERTDGEFGRFRPFPSLPVVDWDDPNLRFVDLDGDGFPDILLNEDQVFRWHRSLGRDGFEAEEHTAKPDDGRGAVPLFTTEHEAVLTGDMTGDGLADIVRIENGAVSYWPNLGYGRFGARVRMAGAPRLDAPDRFDPRRVRLADIDGTGTQDLIYAGSDGIQVHLNLAGNRFETRPTIRSLPAVHDAASFTVTDLWGRGTACLVWSSALPGDQGRTLRWVDPLAGHKPHLLETIDHATGARTTIRHAPSTDFYLADRRAERPWVTRLPFPVQVVAEVRVEDDVAGTQLTTSYSYHHGFYDGVEREFRGFACVEQRDAQAVGPLAGAGVYTRPLDATLAIAPVVTRTWFHTGAFLEGAAVTRQLAHEYWPGAAAAGLTLGDTELPAGLSADEVREAFRALRGRVLRTEVYADDGDPDRGALPFSITETNYTVELRAHEAPGRHAGFAVHARETLRVQLERDPNDPRVQHELVLRTSPYGDIVDHVLVAYPRRGAPADAAQAHTWATWVHTDHVDLDVPGDDYRVGIPTEEVTAELASLAASGLVAWGDVAALVAGAKVGGSAPERRPLLDPAPPDPVLLRRVRHYYWDDAVTKRLDLGSAQPRGLRHQSLVLALDAACLAVVAARATNGETADAVLVDPLEAGYLAEDGGYWATTGVLHYDKDRFYLPDSFTNPWNGVSTVTYDVGLALVVTGMTDAAGLTTTFEIDWRLLAPAASTDANGTRAEVTTDPLGVVIAASIRGAAGEGGPTATVSYDFYAGPTKPSWVRVKTFPAYDPAATIIEESIAYSDGMGREIEKKTRAEDGPLVLGGPVVSPRWAGTGRSIYNEKGLPVKKYEPFFAADDAFDTEAALVTQGVTVIVTYDPLGRTIRTDQPNGTFSTVAIGAWSQTLSDENDTVLDSRWYHDRHDPGSAASAREQDAATAASAHAGTPRIDHVDALGRVVRRVLDDGTETHETVFAHDAAGNLLTMTDADGVLQVDDGYDLAARLLRAHGGDAGTTWTLRDAAGDELYAFHGQGASDGLRVHTKRDAARRVLQVWVWKDGDPPASEALRERVVYGPATGGPALAHGRIVLELDGAGLISYAYDFRGNTAHAERRVVFDYRHPPGWAAAAALVATSPLPAAVDAALAPPLAIDSTHDALGRLLDDTTPDGSTTSRTYNVAGLLETVTTRLGRRPAGPDQSVLFVKNVDHDAHGRPVHIDTGDGVGTDLAYDPQTFRLAAVTSRGPGGKIQDLSYVYDPVGNVISIVDAGQPKVCAANQLVSARHDYVYDPVYRLRQAGGREHPAQAGLDQRDVPAPLPLPTDCGAFVNYTESYGYTKAGDLATLTHTSFLPGGPQTMTRTHTPVSGRHLLQSTTIGADDSTYGCDTLGRVTSMAHLDGMAWDHRDRLIAVTRTRRGNGPSVAPFPPITNPVFFAYDLRGQRVRKVAENGGTVADRVYVGGYELYTEVPLGGGTPSVERETLHVGMTGQRAAIVENTESGAEEVLRYQHVDHVGSAVLELDGNGGLLSYEEYHPYGTTALSVQAAGSLAKRYRFNGKERDEETGLVYYGARYAAPWLGRWLSVDPAPPGSGDSPYIFSSGNPISRFDPDGREDAPVATLRDPVLARKLAVELDKVAQKWETLRSRDAQNRAIEGAVKRTLGDLAPTPKVVTRKVKGGNAGLHSTEDQEIQLDRSGYPGRHAHRGDLIELFGTVAHETEHQLNAMAALRYAASASPEERRKYEVPYAPKAMRRAARRQPLRGGPGAEEAKGYLEAEKRSGKIYDDLDDIKPKLAAVKAKDNPLEDALDRAESRLTPRDPDRILPFDGNEGPDPSKDPKNITAWVDAVIKYQESHTAGWPVREQAAKIDADYRNLPSEASAFKAEGVFNTELLKLHERELLTPNF